MKGPGVDETVEQHFLPDWQLCYYPDPSQYVIFAPYMFANLYPDYQWKPEKPLTNNVFVPPIQIIIQGHPPQGS